MLLGELLKHADSGDGVLHLELGRLQMGGGQHSALILAVRHICRRGTTSRTMPTPGYPKYVKRRQLRNLGDDLRGGCRIWKAGHQNGRAGLASLSMLYGQMPFVKQQVERQTRCNAAHALPYWRWLCRVFVGNTTAAACRLGNGPCGHGAPQLLAALASYHPSLVLRHCATLLLVLPVTYMLPLPSPRFRLLLRDAYVSITANLRVPLWILFLSTTATPSARRMASPRLTPPVCPCLR